MLQLQHNLDNIGGISMRIFAVLHGETDLDTEGRIQGKSDYPLSETGKSQANEIAKALMSKEITLIMSSPQNRAMETAEIIAAHLGIDEAKIAKGMKLHERDFGDYEGKLISELDIFALCSWGGKALTPNGETIRETAGRVIPFLNNMLKLVFKGKTVLLVVSGNVLMVLYWYFKGLPEAGKEYSINTDVSVIHEFETDEIPPDMLDSQTIMGKLISGNAQGSGNADRVLSQPEIDTLIDEMAAEAV